MICKAKEAKVHLSQIVGDKMQKVDLCEDCSKEKGVDDAVGYSLAELLMGVGIEADKAPAAGELTCPHCGFTQADLKKTGRLGCVECYRTFAETLVGLLKSMHKGSRHVGKVPVALREERHLMERLKVLQKKLDQAIHVEDFEQAAKVRDEIKDLRTRASDAAPV